MAIQRLHAYDTGRQFGPESVEIAVSLAVATGNVLVSDCRYFR